MSTTITRTAMTDDDGTGTTGTVFNNAWKTSLYDQIDGLLTATTAGLFSFQITNSSANAAASAAIQALNNGGTGATLQSFSTAFTPSGDAFADGARLLFSGAGGGSITASNAAGKIRIFTGGLNERWNFSSSGHLLASTDNSFDIGASGATRPRNIFVGSSVVFKTKAGTPSDSDVTNPADGMLVLDTTAHKIWMRDGGTWRYAALT